MFTTIGELRQQALWLELKCRTCEHATLIPHKCLPERMADDLPVHLAAAYFRCKGCGGKQISAQMTDARAAQPFVTGAVASGSSGHAGG